VSLTGSAQLQRAGQAAASSAKLGTLLCQNDLLHTDAGSRAALFISAETLVRLDQNSTVRISQTDLETVVEFTQAPAQTRVLLAPDQCGAGYFITRYPKRFRVITPFTNAVVEGTEFLVALRCESTEVAVFEGKVRAEQTLAASQAVSIASGESFTVGEREPPVIKALVKPADAVQWVLYYPPLSETAARPDQACESGSAAEKSRCLTARAEQRLRAGRVDEAQRDIDEATKLLPNNADADALSSVIAVVKNDKAHALELAQRATQLEPLNARAWIALSYAQQASFKLEDALASAERSAELAPRSSTAQARVAELLLSLGKIRSAERAAQAAVEADPNESRAHTILGFVHLAQIDTKKAREDFNAAIERDSSDPLARLGLGLAIIRDGKLKEGREEIEIAVALDPTNSLIRSYVGKAYYEENTQARDKLAATQFGLAKQLDPKDPTPWFYDAILKQTQNRPVEALEELQKSIELNDNRAVYRSRLLLDEDAASRNASVARIYQDLGFDQAAVVESTKSLESDPSNYSAHRFLADAYAQLPRHEIARASELLQAQLRQPLGSPPLQPQLANDELFLLGATGPSSVGLNEYNPLFLRNGPQLQLYGLVGDENTNADQIILSGLAGPAAFSVSQFRFNTDGFRENNDNRKTIYDAFLQVQMSETTSAQLEVASSEQQFGDLVVRFDPENFGISQNEILIDSFRVGLRQQLSPGSDLLVSAIYANRRDRLDIPGIGTIIKLNNVSTKVEAQHLLQTGVATFVTGLGYFQADTTQDVFFNLSSSKPYHFNAYGYALIPLPSIRLTTQLGVSFDHLSAVDTGDLQQTNPKLGLVWTPTSTTTIRAATFRVLRRRINSDQGLEPTQVAGFNQYFDDINGATSRKAAVALDQKLPGSLIAGLAAGKRDISSPQTNGSAIEFNPWTEREALGYLYWTPRRWLAVSSEARWERFERPPGASTDQGFTHVDTWFFPISFRLFMPNGISLIATPTYVNQRGEFYDSNLNLFSGHERFWVMDAFLNYRLPNRSGAVTLGIRNLFNERFRFQSTDPTGSPVSMERAAFIRASIVF
jgi:tetratricopeptide (TPR) repeat protein